MDSDLIEADSRRLAEPMEKMLIEQGPEATFGWLTELLISQRPSLRSSNANLIAYTGHEDAISWLESHVASPVTTHWGEAAALLGADWHQIQGWLGSDRPKQLMALDALYACRLPAPNMSPLAQIAAPALENAPTEQELKSVLEATMASGGNPRMRQTIERMMDFIDQIVEVRERGVEVSDLPRLFLDPESFPNAENILSRHDAVISSMRNSMDKLVDEMAENEQSPNK
jgi:hypothetical protein